MGSCIDTWSFLVTASLRRCYWAKGAAPNLGKVVEYGVSSFVCGRYSSTLMHGCVC
jgi:hypothetical protein